MYKAQMQDLKFEAAWNSEVWVRYKDEVICTIPITQFNAALCGFLQQQGYHAFNERSGVDNLPEKCPHCGQNRLVVTGCNCVNKDDTGDIHGGWPGYVYCMDCRTSIGSIALVMSGLDCVKPYRFVGKTDSNEGESSK